MGAGARGDHLGRAARGGAGGDGLGPTRTCTSSTSTVPATGSRIRTEMPARLPTRHGSSCFGWLGRATGGTTYDFGDGWTHQLTMEKVLAAEPGVGYPRGMSGRRACPPEDVGGPWGLPLHVLATGANAPGRLGLAAAYRATSWRSLLDVLAEVGDGIIGYN